MILPKTELAALLGAKHATPHSVLGMHPLTYKRSLGVVVRALLRGATACDVIELDAQPPKIHPMTGLAPEGAFEVFIAKRPAVFRYQLRATFANGLMPPPTYTTFVSLGAIARSPSEATP